MDLFPGIKKGFNGEKVTIIFPFLPQKLNQKIGFFYWGRGKEMGKRIFLGKANFR
jgi:hypothetical protein